VQAEESSESSDDDLEVKGDEDVEMLEE